MPSQDEACRMDHSVLVLFYWWLTLINTILFILVQIKTRLLLSLFPYFQIIWILSPWARVFLEPIEWQNNVICLSMSLVPPLLISNILAYASLYYPAGSGAIYWVTYVLFSQFWQTPLFGILLQAPTPRRGWLFESLSVTIPQTPQKGFLKRMRV